MADSPRSLLALIDAYATARADRDEAYRECAAWAFDTAHAAMLTARDAVAAALGIAPDAIPAPGDAISRAAADAAERRASISAGAL